MDAKTEVKQLAKRLEKDDAAVMAGKANWDEIDGNVKKAIADGVALQVAEKLEKDGYPEAAEYVRDGAQGGTLNSEDDIEDICGGLFGDDD